jgi:dipeptidyl aminopeptidase/acylaminoacyl peptidase
MKRSAFFIVILFSTFQLAAQEVCSPEFLWSLGRVSGQSISPDGNTVYYSVSNKNVYTEKTDRAYYAIPTNGGAARRIESLPKGDDCQTIGKTSGVKVSPDGQHAIVIRGVKVENVNGKDIYPEMKNSQVYIYDNLNYRHWDTWEDGKYDHPFVADVVSGTAVAEKDLMPGKPYDCPTKPFGGSSDYMFTPDSKHIVYVTKKKSGVDYAESTNTDIYLYHLASGETDNLTWENPGYDMSPSFSKNGMYMAYTQMQREGYEADKNDIILMDWATKEKTNLTAYWDESVSSFHWGADHQTIYFTAAHRGTKQLFKLNINRRRSIEQLTNGQFDIRGILGEAHNQLIVHRGDMNHATELFKVNTISGEMNQLTRVNDAAYNSIAMPEVKPRWTELNDGKQLFSWVIYPPNFDPNKKYPTLLYCQGGPQGALSQFYSYRWNFQLMASQGYIVIAPNRTGMPGWGTAFNEQISGDWGGLAMDHYLEAIDDLATEDYVDNRRIGAVGASYGGYSVFMLAGIHEGRFKTFISHCGLYDLPSWYGTTEELFFANWDIGGPYWDSKNRTARKSYENFSPSSYANDWDTPILIFQGGRDYRVPIGQGLQAFQTAQIKRIKSRLVFLPTENHWVLQPQNAMVWQKEFFRWLKETL